MRVYLCYSQRFLKRLPAGIFSICVCTSVYSQRSLKRLHAGVFQYVRVYLGYRQRYRNVCLQVFPAYVFKRVAARHMSPDTLKPSAGRRFGHFFDLAEVHP